MMQDYEDDDCLMISGIQHFLFCRRQWSLIYVEQQWQDNFFTTHGELLHERADDANLHEKRGDVVRLSRLALKSRELGLVGISDVVELRRSSDGVFMPQYGDTFLAYPIEYKRGKSKANDCDRFQLLAQALCLEEMLLTTIEKGYLFYFATRRREEVLFTETMRQELKKCVTEMHRYYREGLTPKVRTGPQCRSCSVQDVCLPQLNQSLPVEEYMAKYMKD